ncbi:MAG: restriction endonuclease [Lachnospiraceae bacterium]|nr:restriction endonuclease [Lachnospiraceae bacterium]
MYKVSREQYPVNKAWEDKILSTPSIPGGKDNLIENLKRLLLMVEEGQPLDMVPQLANSESKQALKHICEHVLSPMNFVTRTERGFKLTEVAKLWIDSEDNLYLAAYFCANVRFFAEILYYLDTPKKSNELFDIAVNEYDLAWKVTSTINNRLIWLRQFGFIEFQEFSLLYNITEEGKNFLCDVCPVMPESIKKDSDNTIDETEVEVHQAVLDYYLQYKNFPRKPSLGYFPGKIEICDETITVILDYVKNENDIECIYQFAQGQFGIGGSSVKTFLGTLSNMGLIERKGNTEYRVTDLGLFWLGEKDVISLTILLQTKSLFVLELLGELEGNALSAKELAIRAKISYGFDKENTTEIRNRLTLLKKSELIMNVSADKYTLTNRGSLFVQKYFPILGINKQNAKAVSQNNGVPLDIISELRMASKDSFNPARFERAVRDYFALLGYEAEWIGGAGNTDVLIKTKGSPCDGYVVTVDAKSTSSPNVTDQLVDFDTLKEHKEKHKSDYIAIVGRAFESERLVQRAKEHNVVLLDVDMLEKLLKIQTATPLKLSSLSLLFEQAGKAELSILKNEIQRIEKTGKLVRQIMTCLIDEADDPVTNGQLSVRDLYRSLRNNENLRERITMDEIESVLVFLASPIIGCVMKEKDYYVATGSLGDMAGIFDYLNKLCK